MNSRLGILFGGLTAGVMDITAAILTWKVKANVPPIRILQSVASRVDGEGCVCRWREDGRLGIGVSFLDRIHGGNGLLPDEPEDWVFVEQRVGGGSGVRSFGVWIYVLGGDAAFECEARTVFVGSGDYSDHDAHCVCGIADCVVGTEVFELSFRRVAFILKAELACR